MRIPTESSPVLLGVGGMLHRAWNELLTRRGVAHLNLGPEQLDLTRPETITPAIPAACRLFINCAAYTNVDAAEQNEALATAVNGTGVGHLAKWCREHDALLVHYSTDYVFSGTASVPYRTDAPAEPRGAYARGKALGESLLIESGCDHLLVRTSWLYAPWGKNFVRTITDLARKAKPLRVVDDQVGRPTSAEHLARTSLALLEKGARGTFHVTDGGECSWFEFAREIGRLTNPAAAIVPCSTAEYPRPAPRPAYSVLDLSKTEKLVGPMPDWRQNLADVIARVE